MSPRLAQTLDRAQRVLAVVEDGLLVGSLVVLVIMAGGQILLRNLLGMGFMDMDSLSRLLVLWLGMFGAVAASRNRKQINVDVLSPRLPKRARAIVVILMDLFTVAISIAVAWYAVSFVCIEYESGSILFASVPSWVGVSILPLSFGLMAFHYLLHVVDGVCQYCRIDKPS